MDLNELYHRHGKPDPREPLYVRRQLIWHQQPVEVLLVVLVPEKLYVVAEDTPAGNNERLLEGEILVSNKELTQRNGYDVQDRDQTNFSRYRNVYDAIRGLGMPRRRYEAIEVPANQTWHEGLHELTLMCTDLKPRNGYDPAAELFLCLANTLVADLNNLRNDDKINAREKTLLMSPVDKLERYNPSRLPLRAFSAQDALARRRSNTRKIGLHMDLRVLVLADYFDLTFRIRDGVETLVNRILKDKKLVPGCPVLKREKYYNQLAEQVDLLEKIHLRPFGPWSYRQTAQDLIQAAKLIVVGDIDPALGFLRRASYSMRLVMCRRALERVLLIVSRANKLNLIISEQAWQSARRVFFEARGELAEVREEAGFRNTKVLDLMQRNLNAALRYTSDDPRPSTGPQAGIYKALKAACKAV